VKIYQALAEGKPAAVKPLLAAAKNISSERRARIELAIGDKAEAVRLAREASAVDPMKVQPLANLAGILWSADQKDEARATFGKLRRISASLDLDMPVFRRLAPIAAEKNLPTDWRVKATPVANRPELDSLGPLLWQPYKAPEWSLVGKDGVTHSLGQIRGERMPVLVVFYLGSGCSRCIEQLNVFAPLTEKYAREGIKIIAVSTDSPEALGRTFAQAHDPGGFPFPVLADPSLDAFKAYRAFDDFEHIPLHGTFLIDGDGNVRWQNISYQPFRDAAWLLGEAKRLLEEKIVETREAPTISQMKKP
jgi:peroxiredoxin